jgi:hypothetical protein
MKIAAPADFLFGPHTCGTHLSAPRENGHVICPVASTSVDLASRAGRGDGVDGCDDRGEVVGSQGRVYRQ